METGRDRDSEKAMLAYFKVSAVGVDAALSIVIGDANVDVDFKEKVFVVISAAADDDADDVSSVVVVVVVENEGDREEEDERLGEEGVGDRDLA
eukprot:m.124193 g.124193  ORF g.124193 m.124193 type:complete len:94 (+) comp29043_c5_seq1:247-528(+)